MTTSANSITPADPLFDVSELRVVISGGSRGIGLMIAEGFVRRGADVIISSRNAETCTAQAGRLSRLGRCQAIPADLSTEEGVDHLASSVAADGPTLDVLINNAGATWGAAIDDYPVAGFDKVLALNVRGVFRLTQALLPLLEKAATADSPARVINIGSIDGITTSGSMAYAYGASKAAVHHLSRYLARDLAARHITVNTIAPGPFPSKMMSFVLDDAQRRAEIEQAIPLKRIGTADDIVGAAVYLSSRAASFVNGATLVVDEGSSACR